MPCALLRLQEHPPIKKAWARVHSNSQCCLGSIGVSAPVHPFSMGIIGDDDLLLPSQVLSASVQVVLLQNVVVKSGLKTLPSQIHYQPGLQQDHIYDFELCFKVSEDFQNVVDAWNAAVSIAKDIIVQYGRSDTQLLLWQQHSMLLICLLWSADSLRMILLLCCQHSKHTFLLHAATPSMWQ